jgi:hypothetical protein
VGSDQIDVEDVNQLEQRRADLDIPVADEGAEMIGAIFKGAFPHLHEIWKGTTCSLRPSSVKRS